MPFDFTIAEYVSKTLRSLMPTQLSGYVISLRLIVEVQQPVTKPAADTFTDDNITIKLRSSLTKNSVFVSLVKSIKFTLKYTIISPYMFRSLMAIIWELYLYVTKVIFMLKHSVKLSRFIFIYIYI